MNTAQAMPWWGWLFFAGFFLLLGLTGVMFVSILRLGVYEMLYDDDIPVGVAINEAVELAKSFGENESASFINGILGKLARQ